MSRWFRFYDDAVNDPKVQHLPAPLFRGWVNMLCIASKHGGRIPDTAACAFILRISEAQVIKLIKELIGAGLIDDVPETGLEPHNWSSRQHKSDVSTERVKRFREREMERLQKRDETVSRNAPEQNRSTEPNGSADVGTPAPSSDPRTQLWHHGVKDVRRLTGRQESGCRSLVGQWLKLARDDCTLVLRTIEAVKRVGTDDPVAWVEGTLRTEQRKGIPPGAIT